MGRLRKLLLAGVLAVSAFPAYLAYDSLAGKKQEVPAAQKSEASGYFVPDGLKILGEDFNLETKISAPEGSTNEEQRAKMGFRNIRECRGEYIGERKAEQIDDTTIGCDTHGIKPGFLLKLSRNGNPDEVGGEVLTDRISQMVEVARVDEGRLALTDRIKLDYRGKEDVKIGIINPAREVRIDGLIYDGEADKETRGHTIFVEGASNVVISNCLLKNARTSHIWLKDCKNVAVRNCGLEKGLGYRENSVFDGYGLVLENVTGGVIEENRIARVRHAFVLKDSTNGVVVRHNISRDNNPMGNQEMFASDVCFHGGYPYMNTVEENKIQLAHISDYWGNAGPDNVIRGNIFEGMGIIISNRTPGLKIYKNTFERGNIWIREDHVDKLLLDQNIFLIQRNLWYMNSVYRPVIGGKNP